MAAIIAAVLPVAAAAQSGATRGEEGGALAEYISRYLGPPGRFGFMVEGGVAADFWEVSFQDDGPSNLTTAEVTRKPYLLVAGGLRLYKILGYIDWHIAYRTDNVEGALDLRAAQIETGPGRGNTELSSTLQIPLGYVGMAMGLLGVPEDSVYWLNFLRFQFAPTERFFRWETRLRGTQEYFDLGGAAQRVDGTVLFPARYSERRYSVVLGTWPWFDEASRSSADAIIPGGSWEVGFMTMNMTSPMQFRLRRPNTLTNIAVRQFLTTNEASGFYTRLTLGDPATALNIYPDAFTVVVWGDFFSGSTTLATGAFRLSDSSATLVGSNFLGSGNLTASRFGFGGGFYRQYGFGRRNNGRFRWGVNAYWHLYDYGPADLGFVSPSFNRWQTRLTADFANLKAGDPVWVDFFRREHFWGLTVEAAIRF